MKKIFLPFLLAIFLIGCEKDSTSLDEQNLTTNIDNINRGPKPKVDICHYDAENDSWHTINVSENALPAHLNHGDVQLIDADGDGYVSSANECGFPVDCDETDPALTDNCAYCVEYEWSEFLNSIDLTNACSVEVTVGVIAILSFGLNGDICCGLAVSTTGYWESGEDNNFQSGQESPESYTCFLEFLDDKGVPTCDFLTNPISTEKRTPFFENVLETN